MIVFHDRRLAIMTPPKCATNSLHTLLCQPPFRGLVYIGPSRTADGIYDWHTHIWPNEVANFRKFVVVRTPFERLVSLYCHFCGECSGRGNPAPSFEEFVDGVIAEDHAPFYRLNLTKWTEGVNREKDLRHESILDELKELDFEVSAMPNLNRSILRKPHLKFYSDYALDRIRGWMKEDCNNFKYEWPL